MAPTDRARLAHELRGPLTGIRTWCRVLHDHVEGHEDPLVARALAGIDEGIEQQLRVIETLVEGPAANGQPGACERVDAKGETPGPPTPPEKL
jgi:hypothetical protein